MQVVCLSVCVCVSCVAREPWLPRRRLLTLPRAALATPNGGVASLSIGRAGSVGALRDPTSTHQHTPQHTHKHPGTSFRRLSRFLKERGAIACVLMFLCPCSPSHPPLNLNSVFTTLVLCRPKQTWLCSLHIARVVVALCLSLCEIDGGWSSTSPASLMAPTHFASSCLWQRQPSPNQVPF